MCLDSIIPGARAGSKEGQLRFNKIPWLKRRNPALSNYRRHPAAAGTGVSGPAGGRRGRAPLWDCGASSRTQDISEVDVLEPVVVQGSCAGLVQNPDPHVLEQAVPHGVPGADPVQGYEGREGVFGLQLSNAGTTS